jgi:uncharacterized surface protein with fasciclin (FAS1) repeats
MNISKNIVTLSLLSAFAVTGLLSTPAYAQDSDYSKNMSESSYNPRKLKKLDVVGRLAYYADMSTLVAAVTAADLVSTLQGGDFTVLAPSNAAFDKLPAGTVETLVKPENKATLTNILLYHVIPGKVDLSKMEDGAKIKTILGQELTLVNEGYGLQVIDGNGKTFDLSDKPYRQTNGFIYRLDEVLIPS